MLLTKREKFLLALLGFLLLIATYLYYFIFPLTDNISEKREILQRYDTLLTEIEMLTQEQMQIILDDINLDTDNAGHILPSSTKIPELYLDIVEICDKCRICSKNIEFDMATKNTEEIQDDNNLYYFSIIHDFNGNYQQIENYMKEIQENRRKITITEYKITREQSSNTLNASFTLYCYTLLEDRSF